jgi:hypothetical protein
VPTDQAVNWQQGGSGQINTKGYSTPLTITSVQLNGTGRPVLLHRISVRDDMPSRVYAAFSTLKSGGITDSADYIAEQIARAFAQGEVPASETEAWPAAISLIQPP